MIRTTLIALVLVTLAWASPSASATRAHNGPLLAFDSNAHGNEIYIENADGTGVRRLTNDPRTSRWPSLSPDNTHVAFARRVADRSWKIEVTALDGGGLVELPSDGFAGYPDWSPDGTKIVYATGLADRYPMHIEVYDVASATARAITSGSYRDTRPSWSPDGTKVSFARSGYGVFDVMVVGADGSGLVQVTHGAESYPTSSWSPDGTHIVFAAVFSGTTAELWTIKADGTEPTRVTNSEDAWESQPSWSSAGILFAVNATGYTDLYVVNPDGTGYRPVAEGTRDWTVHDPRWSRDGRQIVFASRQDMRSNIAVAKPDGSGYRELTTSPRFDFSPTWSPDGNTVAFLRVVGAGQSDIYTVAADGSHVVNLTVGRGSDWDPAWSPDGTRLAFTHIGFDGGQIWVMNRNGTHLRAVTNGRRDGSWNVEPSWSPDGRRIVYARTQGTVSDLRVYTLATKKTRRLTVSISPSQPTWSPDGTSIAFTGTGPNGFSDIYTITPGGQHQLRVTNHSADEVPSGIETPSWSPDGKQILFVRSDFQLADDDSAVYAVHRDGTGETRLVGTQHETSGTSWEPAP